jgi:hypothetical protein
MGGRRQRLEVSVDMVPANGDAPKNGREDS